MKGRKIFTYILLGISIVLVLTNIIVGIFYTKNFSIYSIISYVLLILFTLFITLYISNLQEKKFTFLNISLVFLMIYNFLLLDTSFANTEIKSLNKLSANVKSVLVSNEVENFVNQDYNDLVKWSNNYNVKVEETYEYSDIVPEGKIIYQDVESGTKVSSINKLKVSISDGKDPNKEVLLGDMNGKNVLDVLEYIEKNSLNNVKIKYEDSDLKEDSLINQSVIGTIKRSDEVIFTFSLKDTNTDNVKLIDLKNMTKLRAMAYLEKYQLNYEFVEEFSNTIKKGNVIKQNVKKDTIISGESNNKIVVTISKGKEVKVPNLLKYSLDDVLVWSSKFKIKLEIEEKIDDSVKKGNIISCSAKENDVIEERSKIKVTISKGQVKMKEFDNIDDFKAWADKLTITYQIEYDSSDSIESGKIIKFSHKKDEVIKNNDTIVVTISTGKSTTVANFIGMSKENIIKKCKSINLKCRFQYENSTKKKDIATRQSLRAGSKVSDNSSISITLSNGKKPEEKKNNSNTSSNSSNKQNYSNNSNKNSNNNSNSNNNNTNNPQQPSQQPQEPAKPACIQNNITLSRALLNIFDNTNGYNDTVNKLNSYFNSINVNVNIVSDKTSGKQPGLYIGGIGPGSVVKTCCPGNCPTYSITISE